VFDLLTEDEMVEREREREDGEGQDD